MDPITLGLVAGGGLGAVSSGISAVMGNKQAKQERRNREEAIRLLQDAMNQQYSGLYGATADINGMSTGNAFQDALLRRLTEQVQAKEIQAALINNAVANRTDRQARNEYLLNAMLNIQKQNDAAVASASRQGRIAGMDMSNLLLNAGRNANAQKLNAINQARYVNNNNLARIGAGTNLNTGSVADVNRQTAQNLYNAAANNRSRYTQQIANLRAGMPTNQSAGLAALQSGLTGGAAGATLGYMYDKFMPQTANTQKLTAFDSPQTYTLPQQTGTAMMGQNMSWRM